MDNLTKTVLDDAANANQEMAVFLANGIKITGLIREIDTSSFLIQQGTKEAVLVQMLAVATIKRREESEYSPRRHYGE